MKKFFIVLLAVVVLSLAVFFLRFKHGPPGYSARLLAGGAAQDFILGMKGTALYHLNDFLGKYIVMLVFLDNGTFSGKFEALLDSKFRGYLRSVPSLLWFNIKNDGTHAVISEETSRLGLLYRTPCSAIPSFYSAKNLPLVVLISKNGIIKLVYSGYSPTILDDLSEGIRGLKQ